MSGCLLVYNVIGRCKIVSPRVGNCCSENPLLPTENSQLNRKFKIGPQRLVLSAFLDEYGRTHGLESPVGRISKSDVPARVPTIVFSNNDLQKVYSENFP